MYLISFYAFNIRRVNITGKIKASTEALLFFSLCVQIFSAQMNFALVHGSMEAS